MIRFPNCHFAGDHRVLLVVTSSTSKVEKGAQLENKQSIWSLGGIRGRSLHGKYLVPVPTLTIPHRLVDLTDVLTRPPFVKLQPLSVLDLVAGKRKSSWIQVIANRLSTYGGLWQEAWMYDIPTDLTLAVWQGWTIPWWQLMRVSNSHLMLLCLENPTA